MDIKKAHATKEIVGTKKTGFHTPEVKNGDSLKISDQAKLLAEVGFYKKMILSKIPDIRENRVAEARERLLSGYYTSEKVLDSVSQTFSHLLGEEEL